MTDPKLKIGDPSTFPSGFTPEESGLVDNDDPFGVMVYGGGGYNVPTSVSNKGATGTVGVEFQRGYYDTYYAVGAEYTYFKTGGSIVPGFNTGSSVDNAAHLFLVTLGKTSRSEIKEENGHRKGAIVSSRRAKLGFGWQDLGKIDVNESGLPSQGNAGKWNVFFVGAANTYGYEIYCSDRFAIVPSVGLTTGTLFPFSDAYSRSLRAGSPRMLAITAQLGFQYTDDAKKPIAALPPNDYEISHEFIKKGLKTFERGLGFSQYAKYKNRAQQVLSSWNITGGDTTQGGEDIPHVLKPFNLLSEALDIPGSIEFFQRTISNRVDDTDLNTTIRTIEATDPKAAQKLKDRLKDVQDEAEQLIIARNELQRLVDKESKSAYGWASAAYDGLSGVAFTIAGLVEGSDTGSDLLSSGVADLQKFGRSMLTLTGWHPVAQTGIGWAAGALLSFVPGGTGGGGQAGAIAAAAFPLGNKTVSETTISYAPYTIYGGKYRGHRGSLKIEHAMPVGPVDVTTHVEYATPAATANNIATRVEHIDPKSGKTYSDVTIPTKIGSGIGIRKKFILGRVVSIDLGADVQVFQQFGSEDTPGVAAGANAGVGFNVKDKLEIRPFLHGSVEKPFYAHWAWEVTPGISFSIPRRQQTRSE